MTADALANGPALVVSSGHFYRPEPSYFEDELAQQQLFDSTLGKDTLRRLDPFAQAALYAVEQARQSCRSQLPKANDLSHGVVVGTGLGAQATRLRYTRRLAKLGPSATNPIDFPDSIDGAAAAHIAMRWGLSGPSLTFVDGRESADDAVMAACRQILLHRAERMYLVVGDIYEPWLKGQIGGSFECADVAADTGQGARCEQNAPILADGVLALILDRYDPNVHRDTDVFIVGAFELAGHGPSLRERRFRAVSAPRESSLDPSGVLGVAGAWQVVTAPMGKQLGSCQDQTVDATGIEVGFGLRTRLAFCRKVGTR